MGYGFDLGALLPYLGLFLEGAAVTVGLTAVAGALGILFGILGAAAALSRHRWCRGAVIAFVEAIRNTPFIVQMFFIFFGLPSLGLRLGALTAAALAMTINLTAYAIEILRAGIVAVPAGQSEAGRASGLKPLPVFCLIVLPQALANVYPALVGQTIITMLESAVVSQIAVVDLAHVGDLVQSRNFRPFETYGVIAITYLVLVVLLRRLFGAAGRRLFAGRTP